MECQWHSAFDESVYSLMGLDSPHNPSPHLSLLGREADARETFGGWTETGVSSGSTSASESSSSSSSPGETLETLAHEAGCRLRSDNEQANMFTFAYVFPTKVILVVAYSLYFSKTPAIVLLDFAHAFT